MTEQVTKEVLEAKQRKIIDDYIDKTGVCLLHSQGDKDNSDTELTKRHNSSCCPDFTKTAPFKA